ncbi:MAG TPA: histidine--tRNA ligase [Chloroflexia bacterium]|nr:histidine--tRNA ligase [Chloroflexia bacterium]
MDLVDKQSKDEKKEHKAIKIEPVKGTRDFYPDKMRWRNWLFSTCRRVSQLYSYEEYDGPFLEYLDLYAAKSGEELVNEQTYTFDSRGGEKLAIRPEMTPTLARMVAAKQNELRKPIRWFTFPNIWRYEKPQRGRKREFYQYNIDLLGVESMEAEAEILAVVVDIMKALGLGKGEFVIRVNNRYFLEDLLGKLEIDLNLKDAVYREIDRIEKLKPEVFRANLQDAGLSEEQISKLETTLRQKDFGDFPALESLWEKFTEYDITDFVEFDPSIVRGLLYYTGTVFEVWDPTKRFNRAIMGGGRYDNLVTALGGQPLPAVGIAFSDVTIEEMLTQQGKMPNLPRDVDVYVAQYSAAERPAAIKVASQLRSDGLRTEVNILDHSLDKQLKAASASGARFAVIVAPDELARGEVNVKNLQQRSQQTVKLDELSGFLQQ